MSSFVNTTSLKRDAVKILMVGNGFDLAHGLPTSYIDFLKFIDYIQVTKEYHIDSLPDDEVIKNIFLKELDPICQNYIFNYLTKKEINACKKIVDLTQNNIWIMHFKHKLSEKKQNWIDFEAEISSCVQNFEVSYNKYKNEEITKKQDLDLLEIFGYTSEDVSYLGKTTSYETYKKNMLIDLDRLIIAFELYLTECVEKIKINKISPDIASQNFNYVLSFNYTNTYARKYDENRLYYKKIEYDYIHGKAGNNPNNMVLGISEYLKGNDKNTHTDFIEFKKYFQRIHKATGCQYKKWLENIKKNSFNAELYIFGHSLDITDGDIIRELMMFPNMRTTIYYHTREAYGKQIASLVKILGQDNLIEMVHGVNPKIIFKKQSEMVLLDKPSPKEVSLV